MAKGPKAFRTISEAAEEVGAPQHVLRFWETRFDFISPLKRAGGRRFYRLEDVAVLKAVRRLLHDEGMTIRGVQRLHAERGAAVFASFAEPGVRLDFDSSLMEDPASGGEIDKRLDRVLILVEHAHARLAEVLAH